MPFVVHKNCDGTYKVANADTGKVYAYATAKPTEVMSIVNRTSTTCTSRKSSRPSGRRKSGRKTTRNSGRRQPGRRQSVRRGRGQYGCASWDKWCIQTQKTGCNPRDTACMMQSARRVYFKHN